MPTTIELIAKPTHGGATQAFKFVRGGKHAAQSQMQYTLVVDGNVKLPPGTKVFKHGKNLEIKFPDGNTFEISDFESVNDTSVTNLENSQQFTSDGYFIPVANTTNASDGSNDSGSSEDRAADVPPAAPAANSHTGSILAGIGVLALLGAAAGGGGGGGGGGGSSENPSIGVIKSFAKSNGGGTPTTADYTNAGVTGVTPDNLAAINSALATTAIGESNVDTPA